MKTRQEGKLSLHLSQLRRESSLHFKLHQKQQLWLLKFFLPLPRNAQARRSLDKYILLKLLRLVLPDDVTKRLQLEMEFGVSLLDMKREKIIKQ